MVEVLGFKYFVQDYKLKFLWNSVQWGPEVEGIVPWIVPLNIGLLYLLYTGHTVLKEVMFKWAHRLQ